MQGAVVAAFDHLEMALGSCGLFRLAMGVVLLDRGEEFGDVGGMERSRLSPGEKRCRVYFCDPMSPGQKGRCERASPLTADAPSTSPRCCCRRASSNTWESGRSR